MCLEFPFRWSSDSSKVFLILNIAASFGSVLIVRLKSLLTVVTRCKISGGTRYNMAQEKSPADF